MRMNGFVTTLAVAATMMVSAPALSLAADTAGKPAAKVEINLDKYVAAHDDALASLVASIKAGVTGDEAKRLTGRGQAAFNLLEETQKRYVEKALAGATPKELEAIREEFAIAVSTVKSTRGQIKAFVRMNRQAYHYGATRILVGTPRAVLAKVDDSKKMSGQTELQVAEAPLVSLSQKLTYATSLLEGMVKYSTTMTKAAVGAAGESPDSVREAAEILAAAAEQAMTDYLAGLVAEGKIKAEIAAARAKAEAEQKSGKDEIVHPFQDG